MVDSNDSTDPWWEDGSGSPGTEAQPAPIGGAPGGADTWWADDAEPPAPIPAPPAPPPNPPLGTEDPSQPTAHDEWWNEDDPPAPDPPEPAGVQPPSPQPAPPRPEPARINHPPGHDPHPEPGAPKLFISYRRADTEPIAKRLDAMLRKDLGYHAVYRDQRDLIGGEKWRDGLSRAIDASNTGLILIGKDWKGPDGNGNPRIYDSDDPVRSEVVQILDEDTNPVPVPILLDVTDFPSALPPDLNALRERHAITATTSSIVKGTSSAYQGILVGVWKGVMDKSGDSTLIISKYAQASLPNLVATLKAQKKHVGELSRVAAGVYSTKPRRIARAARRWPDVIVLTDDEQVPPTLPPLLEALEAHPAIGAIAVLGAGAAAAVGAATLSTGSAASYASPAQMASTLPSAGMAPAAMATGFGAKAALAVTGLAVAAGGTYVAVNNDPGSPLDFASSTTLVVESDETDNRFYPLGVPDDANVRLGDPRPVDGETASGTGGLVSRSVELRLPGNDPIDLGDVELPTELSSDFLAANATANIVVDQVVATNVRLDYDELRSSAYCFPENNPSDVVGGYAYIGEPAQVVVTFAVTTEGAQIVGASITAGIEAPAELEVLGDFPPDLNLDRCLAASSASTTWSSD